jgi:hypothetical protein
MLDREGRIFYLACTHFSLVGVSLGTGPVFFFPPMWTVYDTAILGRAFAFSAKGVKIKAR